MLTRASRATPNLSFISISKRNFFDYLRVAQEVEGGKSITEIESEFSREDDTKAADSFGWQWLSWFEENAPEKYSEYASQRSQFNRWEQYLGERGIKSSKKINFSDYRNKISDPLFVDNLEINYYFENTTISSIENMNTLNEWNTSSIKSFKEECESKGDIIVAPLSSEDKQKEKQNLEEAEAYDEKMKLMAGELLKDFEQVDAERMMLGQHTMYMNLSQHPQYAETLEDIYTAKHAYLDFAMLPIHNDYVKRERLVTCQDEERRKAFLERFEEASKIKNGQDCTVPN
eukprot:55553_1